jgi:hypothetical protein
MVRCATIHTRCWWKWTFPCIMSRLLAIMTYHWSSTSSKTSSHSSSTSVACSISSQRVILRCLIILCGIVLRLCCIVLWFCGIIWLLCSIILLLRSVVWVGTWLNCGAACLVIISAYTLYASDVLSHIKSIVLQSLSSWPADLKKLQYELIGNV